MLVYLAKGEVEEFERSGSDSVDGYAFEWEDEDVVHLHINRPIHGFGRERKCRFSVGLKARESVMPEVSYFVHIANGSAPVAYCREGEGWKELDLSFIPSISASGCS